MTAVQAKIKRYQRGWRILILFISAALLVSLTWMITTTPLYRASATFLVYPNDTLTSSRDVVSSLDTLDKRTISATYADILASTRVVQDTVERLQIDPAGMEQVRVFSEVEPETNILKLNVEGPDPVLIALLANNIGQNGISFIQSIYQVFDITFLDLAVEPETPFHPRPVMDNLIAALIGLGVGLVFVVLRESFNIPLDALRERSKLDDQSGAYTRRHLVRKLNQEVLKPEGEPLAVALIQLRGLEELVDELPERYLSVILRSVVEHLDSLLRGNDLVGRWDRLSFGVMLPGTPRGPAEKTVERLLKSLEGPLMLDTGESIDLDPAAGLVLRGAEDTLDTMVDRSEEALDRAREGADRIVVDA